MPGLEYLAAQSDAERRMKAGQRQWWCVRCQLWQWRDVADLCPVA
jgi:hypothetical protein